jgi:hypothetical protein
MKERAMSRSHYESYQVFLVLLQKGRTEKRLGLGGLYEQLVNWWPQGNQPPVVSVGAHSGVSGIWIRGDSLPDLAATLRVGVKGGQTVAIAHCLKHTAFETLPRIPGLFRNNCRHYPLEPRSFVWAQPQHEPNDYPFTDPEWSPRLG